MHGRRTGIATVVGLLLAPAPAHAATRLPLSPLVGPARAELVAEAAALGPEHAIAHYTQRAAPRQDEGSPPEPFDPCRPRGDANAFDPSRPLPPKDRPTGQARCGTLPKQPSTPAALRRQGRWTKDVLDLPHYAIHTVLLPSGKVLFWGFEWTQRIITRNPGSHRDTSSEATVWDPRKGTGPRAFRSVPAPLIDLDGDGDPERVPLYCSGQTLLPDGRVLVTGGTLDLRWAERGYTNPPGIRLVLIFDPRTETWSRAQDMTVARWYPTQTELADGRTLVLGGYGDDRPTTLTGTLDVVSADGRRTSHAPSGDRRTWTYPGMLLMPSGRVLLAGPLREDTGVLDPATLRWSATKPLPDVRGGGNLVPVPTRTGASPQAMLIGGTDFKAPEDHGVAEPRAYRSTWRYDERRAARGWASAPSQVRARNWPNTVLLPDGSMVTVGGGRGITTADAGFTPDRRNRRVELWDPASGRWRLGAAQREDRTYHSVALLLPDGRVWSAGDDANPNRDGDTGELYQPPYLFRGPRPRVLAAPARVPVGTSKRFTVDVAGPVPDRITLLHPSSTTHALDMGQRFVELRVVRRTARPGGRTRVTLAGLRSRAVAPPGPYMLFALSRRGAPSPARWTSVR